MGRNADEQVAVATLMGVFKDFYRSYLDLIYGEHKESFEELKPGFIEKFIPYLTKFSSILGEREYYCGGITYVDFYIAEFIQHLNLLESSIF